MAADGNLQTYWESAHNDRSPYWTLDTEKNLLVIEITIYSPRPNTGNYTVELSGDNINWEKVSHEAMVSKEGTKTTWNLEKVKQYGRFVRIRFEKNSEAALSEMTVKGFVQE